MAQQAAAAARLQELTVVVLAISTGVLIVANLCIVYLSLHQSNEIAHLCLEKVSTVQSHLIDHHCSYFTSLMRLFRA